jgi:hypothetical protein
MGGVLYEKGEYLNARGFLQRYEAIAGAQPASLLLGRNIELRMGNASGASEYSRKLLRNFPSHPKRFRSTRRVDGGYYRDIIRHDGGRGNDEGPSTCIPGGGAGIDEQGSASGSQMMLPLREETDVATAHEFDDGHLENADTTPQPRNAESLGARLRDAREAHGWNVGDVVAELRIPARIIERLEDDDYAGFSDAVFLRGYLNSYARLVGVPVDETVKVVDAHARVAPLVATGTISRSRYLFERYSAGATYLTLTAIIVVPAVWLATHGGLQQNLARVTPLDPPPAHVADIAQDDAFRTRKCHEQPEYHDRYAGCERRDVARDSGRRAGADRRLDDAVPGGAPCRIRRPPRRRNRRPPSPSRTDRARMSSRSRSRSRVGSK